jgi:UDP-glucose 4-epimerase
MFILVTGGCGFIGSHVCEALVRAGHRVRVLDNLSSGFRHHLAAVADQVEVRLGDVRDAQTVFEACRGVEAVFHEAALVSVADSVARPRDNHDINVTGTLNVLEAARTQGARRVVLASSAAVYGNDPALPKRESMRPQPASPYAVAKLAGEHYLQVYRELYGMENVALRYFNVYGPRQSAASPYSGVISKFVQCLQRGIPPTVCGDGLQSRDFVYVKDVVQANLAALTLDGAEVEPVFNVASGRVTTLLDLVRVLGELAGRPLDPEFAPPRAGDIRHSAADITQAMHRLGYRPGYALSDGLRLLLEHVLSQGAGVVS